MKTNQPMLKVLAERPIVRDDQTSDIDIAVDLVTSKAIGTQSATYAINLCIVIDRSGSMQGEKLEQAQKSCLDIYESLNPADRLTVLAFNGEVVSVVTPQTPAALVKEHILALRAEGQTDLSKGWYLGLLELQTYATDQHINRLLLLSDGQANEGEQKPSVLAAESNRARSDLGVTTSTIGIGTDFREDILGALAHESGGRFWYIGEARIEDIIKEEFSGALSVFLERPRIEVSLPPGVSILRELNDLPKISGRYRIRPIKANDQFSFALRLRVDPTLTTSRDLPIRATLFDGAGVVEEAETALRLGSVEEYVRSLEDPRVENAVRKYLAATSDEKIIEQMDAGNVTGMLNMLLEQSDTLTALETRLTGERAMSLESMTEQDREQVEQEIARLRMEVAENETLTAVSELVDLMRGLGRMAEAGEVLACGRKMHRQRAYRNFACDLRGEMDDWAARTLLEASVTAAADLAAAFPDLAGEIGTIRRRLDEQLARFS